jgi:hypothetical protein
MNTEALFLFLILLLGLVLCSFLGGTCGKEGMTNNADTNRQNTTSNNNSKNNSNFDNYNHFSGNSTSLTTGKTFYGPNGGSVVVSTDSNGKQTLKVKISDKENEMILNTTKEGYTNYYGNNGSATTFYGPNNTTATVIYTNDGQEAINVQTSSGSYTFTQSGSTYNPNNTSYTQYYGSTGQTNNSASAGAVTGPYGNTAYYAEGPNGNVVAGTTSASSTQYYGPNGSATTVEGAYGGSAGAVTGPYGNTAYYAQGPNGNTVAGTTNYDYSNYLPPGVPRSQIPPGQEDLYILKSEVVPPVCPVCPAWKSDPDGESKCPPCPACARCPEPSFECKKVPNYNAINDNFLPQPVISDFSSFGM